MALNLPAKLSEAKDSGSIFLVELYVFALKTGNLYLCSADQDVTYNGQLYKAVPMERDKCSANTESKVSDCALKVNNCDDSFTAAIFSGVDFRGCTATIFQILYPDALTDTSLVKPILMGYLDSPVLKSKDATFEVQVKSFVPNLTNSRTMQLSCCSTFADQESCFANKDIKSGTVQPGTTASSIIVQQNESANYRINGIITCGYESRIIESSSGNVITLHYPFSFVPTGTYTMERGCDKTVPSCATHNQQMNYSGYPSIPRELVIR